MNNFINKICFPFVVIFFFKPVHRLSKSYILIVIKWQVDLILLWILLKIKYEPDIRHSPLNRQEQKSNIFFHATSIIISFR